MKGREREETDLGTHARLDITPTGIIAMHRGQRTVVPMDPTQWDAAIKADFATLASPIAEAVSQAGLRGKGLEVCYESRDAAVEMLTLPLASHEAQAAAGLRVRESLGGSMVPSQITSARVPSGKSNASTTLLLAGERTRAVEAIAGLVRSAGAVPELLIPIRATTMRAAIASVLAYEAPSTTVVLWLDRHGASLAGGSGGVCRFARLLGGGYDLFVEALTRASREVGGLDNEHATELLLRVGIPQRGQMIDESRGLSGERVMPLLQPILQRFAVEIKQTIRFGLPEGESNRAELLLAGPGGQIPGLAETLASMIDTSVKVVPDSQNAVRSRIEALMPLGMTPAATAARRSFRRLLAAASLGAVAAGAAITGDILWSQAEISRLRAEVSANQGKLDIIRRDLATRDRIVSLRSTLGKLDALTDATIGRQPSWAAGIALASRLGIEGLQVHELTGLISSDGPTMIVKGLLPAPEGSANPVSALIDKLTSSPLASQVRIGSSRLVESDGLRAVQFAVTVLLSPLDPGDIVRLGSTNAATTDDTRGGNP